MTGYPRFALASHGILDPMRESCCINFFKINDENFHHLFFDCTFSQSIWEGVVSWLGIHGPFSQVPVDHIFLTSWEGRSLGR